MCSRTKQTQSFTLNFLFFSYTLATLVTSSFQFQFKVSGIFLGLQVQNFSILSDECKKIVKQKHLHIKKDHLKSLDFQSSRLYDLLRVVSFHCFLGSVKNFSTYCKLQTRLTRGLTSNPKSLILLSVVTKSKVRKSIRYVNDLKSPNT